MGRLSHTTGYQQTTTRTDKETKNDRKGKENLKERTNRERL